jgi:pimeloyl-ACP methyl ester carboxylesterase
MVDSTPMAPLAAFRGQKPPAPPWFDRVVAVEPERTFVTVDGAKVETLAWGERGKPGLVLLHGGAAHGDWWSFIAPFFAGERRIVAPSFSGMGRSDWRESYNFRLFVREAQEIGRAAGAYDAGPPVVVGHSFGGRIAIGVAHDSGDEIAAAVMVDPPFFAPQNQRAPAPPRASSREHSVRPSLEAIVARFRLAPPQACANLYILDFIARRSARQAVNAGGGSGWSLSFDPHFWEKFGRLDAFELLKAVRAPLAIIRGSKSQLFQAEDAAYLRTVIAPDSPYVEIPEAEHHVMIDQPLAFVAALRALLAAWSPAKTG